MDAAADIIHQEQFAAVGFAERRDPKRRINQLAHLVIAGRSFGQTPYLADGVIAKNIPAVQSADGAAAINKTAGDRLAYRTIVIDHRIDKRTRGGAGVVCRGKAFTTAPAIVSAALNDINLFERTLTDIAHPQGAVDPVETPAPGIAQTVSVNFRGTAATGKRVIRRNTIRRTVVDVNPQHRAEPGVGVLPVVERVIAGAAVAETDIQVTVRPERDVAAVMIVKRLVQTENVFPAGGIQGSIRRLRVTGDIRHHGYLTAVTGFSKRQKHLPVVLIFGMERHAQQARFHIAVHYRRQINIDVLGGGIVVGCIYPIQRPGLLQYVPA